MTMTPAAVVTGAGRGIGRGIALELAAAGFDICGIDIAFDPNRTDSGLFEVRERILALGRDFLALEGDVAALDRHENMLQAVLRKFGRVDVLVNNAGVAPLERKDILETGPESYDRLMATNARGAFFLTQRFAREMIRQAESRPGMFRSIIFITSVSAEASSTSRPEYCISKAALSMTAALFADALAGRGIPVYEIRPGIIRTDMTAPVKDAYDRRIADGLVPQGRWGEPADVGRAVAALAGGAFAFSTGAVIEVSGGLNIRRL